MDVNLPDLGENVDEAEVLNVLVQKGDAVAKDQPVLELETDKATFELPCPQAGTVSAIHVKEGDTVRVGQKILTLEAGAAATKAAAPAPRRGESRREGKTEPEARDEERSGRNEPEAEEQKGSKQPKARDEEHRAGREPAARDEEQRAGEEPDAEDEEPGRAPSTRRKPQDREPEGKARAKKEPESREDSEPTTALTPERAAGDGEAAAGPAARRLARELDVDLVRIRGTGSGGRITPEDVQAFVRDRASAARAEGPATEPARREAATTAPGVATRAGERAAAADTERAAPAGDTARAAAAGDADRWGPVERRALTGIEKAAARHLSASWREIPHVTHHDLADVTELEEARRRYESGRKESEPKLTWTALVVKAVVAGLRAFPRVNSSLDAEAEELVIRRYVHIGVAVDTEHGLLVPVVRDADRKTTREIAAEVAALAERARERKLGREDMQGASFTVTNLGGIGGVGFTPIVSRPEVAILGVSRSREDLALRDGQVVRRIVLPLSLSYDHRVVNGADAARFVRRVAELLEDPLHLLMES